MAGVLEALSLCVALDYEVLIDLTHNPEQADSFAFLDQGGKSMEIAESMVAYLTLWRRVKSDGPRSNVLKAGEDASLLVLHKNEEEVRRQQVRLNPMTRTTIKP